MTGGAEDLAEMNQAPTDGSVVATQEDAFDKGVSDYNADQKGVSAKQYAEQCALAEKWANRIKTARAYDENIRKQYAINRRYLRGKSGFAINVPIAPSYVEILTSILYAKNPDLATLPAPSTTPPPMASVIEMAREKKLSDPETSKQMEMVGIEAEQTAYNAHQEAMTQAAAQGVNPATIPPLPPAGVIGEQAGQEWLNKAIKKDGDDMMKPYRRALEDAKQFAKTIDVLVQDAWTHAKLKTKGKKILRSTLSHGNGFIKASWQDRTGTDPVGPVPDDAKQSMAVMAQTADRIDNDEATKNVEADKARLDAQHTGMAVPREVMHRGFVVDYVPLTDVQMATETYSMEDYLEAPWLAHRFFRERGQAQIDYPDVKEQLEKAQSYYPVQPKEPTENNDTGPVAVKNADANEAELYSTNANLGATATTAEQSVCGWEIWSKTDGVIYTIIEGVKGFACKPFVPNVPTTRFYPFFQLAMHWVEGKRNPDSLIERTSELLDEVNATHSDARTHRRRAIPKTIGNAAYMAKAEAEKITNAVSNEIVWVELTNPKMDLNKVMKNFEYPQFDPKLYDDSKAKAEIETAWGIQEALSSSIATAKTATEAEIQQTGTNARTGLQRDEIDELLNDLAQYTAEILVQKYTHQQAVEIAGSWAFWPGQGEDGAEPISLDRMHSLITVKIKAGSSGKPNTTSQQQTWAVTLPLLDQKITDIGMLRGSSREDIANCKEELVTETLARAGEGLDTTRFIPQAPSEAPGERPDPQQQQQPPMQGPQPTVHGAPHPMPATLPAPNGAGLPVPHKGHITQHNRPPAAMPLPGNQ